MDGGARRRHGDADADHPARSPEQRRATRSRRSDRRGHPVPHHRRLTRSVGPRHPVRPAAASRPVVRCRRLQPAHSGNAYCTARRGPGQLSARHHRRRRSGVQMGRTDRAAGRGRCLAHPRGPVARPARPATAVRRRSDTAPGASRCATPAPGPSLRGRSGPVGGGSSQSSARPRHIVDKPQPRVGLRRGWGPLEAGALPPERWLRPHRGRCAVTRGCGCPYSCGREGTRPVGPTTAAVPRQPPGGRRRATASRSTFDLWIHRSARRGVPVCCLRWHCRW